MHADLHTLTPQTHTLETQDGGDGIIYKHILFCNVKYASVA